MAFLLIHSKDRKLMTTIIFHTLKHAETRLSPAPPPRGTLVVEKSFG